MDYKADYKIINLVFSMYYNPGVYALLIGSGVSKAAGIKTGWEIVLDLIGQLALSLQEDPKPDPETWYAAKFNEEPDYSKILEKLAKTPYERMNILKKYFEPTEEEKEQQLKVPTEAHKVIAQMIKLGYIKMILTTNFDRLLEKAIEEVGITPDIIKSEDDFEGAMPYVHSKCFIVKVHGDYKDTRIRNTIEELSNFSDTTSKFLDEIFDKYGLIICGWSSKWDNAIREAILKSPNRRFQTYWLAKGELEEEAKQIVTQRRAEIIQIESADQVFTELLEKVKSLSEFERKSPMSIETEVAMVKRYISDSKDRIRLHEFVMERTEEVYKKLNPERFDLKEEVNETSFQKRMQDYETVTEPLIKIMLPIAYYDKGENSLLLTKTIDRIASAEKQSSVFAWSQLQKYPSLLILYALGLCALSANNFVNLAAILRNTQIRDGREKSNLIIKINPTEVFYTGGLASLIKRPDSKEFTPASNYLFDIIRPLLKDYIPDDNEYGEIFDKFEYLFALNYIDLKAPDLASLNNHIWAPIGCFGWKYSTVGTIHPEDSLLFDYVEYIKNSGTEFGLFKAGFFGGQVDRFIKIEESFRKWFLEVTGKWPY
jgi:hypothetical protein